MIDPNGGSPNTNVKGILFDRASAGNKKTITLSLPGIWTVLAGTDEQQTCAIAFHNSSNELYTYKFDHTTGTATNFANITLIYGAQVAATGVTITEFAVADNCDGIKFNNKIYHYNSTAGTYLPDTMPVGATGFISLDEPFRTAIIGGTIY